MNTPICDFLESYTNSKALRLHMPGHNGSVPSDITEIAGADSLYETDYSNGVIAKSEQIAAGLFGAERTCYSTGGSTLAIQAALAMLKAQGCKTIAAPRFSHRSFVSAAAALGLDVKWLYSKEYPSASADFSKKALEGADALFFTNIDYYGGSCHVRNPHMPVVCDNAHGAYLKFVSKAAFGTKYLHPMEMSFPVISAESAHKTLPVLTGGAYLHFSKGTDYSRAKEMTALFGTSSPSYLILESLDSFNGKMTDDPDCINRACDSVSMLKRRLTTFGFSLRESDHLRIVINARHWGYSGQEFAAFLRYNGAECEMADANYTVLMFSGATTMEECERAEMALCLITRRKPMPLIKFPILHPQKEMPVYEAVFKRQRTVPAEKAEGEVCGSISTVCPPCVPVIMPGERIDRDAVEAFRLHGIQSVNVLA